MVYVPRAAVTPHDDPPVIQPFPGMDSLRRQTHWFIENDPTTIVLVPTERVRAPGGGFNVQPLAPRPAQKFKMIFQSGIVDGVVEAADGINRRYDFVLLGEWDATVHIGDTFTEPEYGDQKWVIQGIQPFNGYEVKAGVVSYGRNPQHG